jgi:3-phosphoshikimate 1-carboxyvinyltransferase
MLWRGLSGGPSKVAPGLRLRAGDPPEGVTVAVPGDKSVTHRALLLGLLARGTTQVSAPLLALDTLRSLEVTRAFGARVTERPGELIIESPGLGSLREPDQVIDCGNSGTTMRLAAGIAATVPGLTVLTGDASLRRRPMARVTGPLQVLGVTSWTRADGCAPIAVRGGAIRGGRVNLPVASAQVKSALLLAGLAADGPVTVVEPVSTRDHTERMLRAQGIDVVVAGGAATVHPGTPAPIAVKVPGDPSSAAFWWAWAAVRGGLVVTDGVLLNPGRTGFLQVLRRMGAVVTEEVTEETVEPVGRVTVSGPQRLGPVTIDGSEVPSLVDELPLVAVLATQAEGHSLVTGAGELRVKESDRIQAMGDALRAMGAEVSDRCDGWAIEGGGPLGAATVDALGDHRVAMALLVAATRATGPVTLLGADAVSVSYPGFVEKFVAAGALRAVR